MLSRERSGPPYEVSLEPTTAFQLISPFSHWSVISGPVALTTVWPSLTIANSTGPVWPRNGTEKWLMPAVTARRYVGRASPI